MDIYSYKDQLKDFLGLNLDRCMQAVNAQAGSIFILDRDKQELVLEVVRNGKKKDLEGLRAKLGDRVAGRVALKNKPILVKNVDREPTLKKTRRYSHYKSKSFLSVPLEISGDVVGVLNLNDKDTGIAFDDKDLKTVKIICKYLGIALNRLMGYLESQKEINEKLSKELVESKKDIDRYKKFSSLGKFVGGVVHEINNPLDGALRFINLSIESANGDEVLEEYLLEAKKGLNRIAGFVRSLLDFSWSLSAPGRSIDVNNSIYEALFQYHHHFVSYNIKVFKSFSSDLDKVPDYGLKIVFNNMVKNAVEAMKEKGGDLTVTTLKRKDAVEIRFEDSGCGIDEGFVDKIFDPFFTTKNIGEGSGLGLAICHEIMTRYQGDIFVESSPEKGTKFTIRIPFKKLKH